MSCSTVVLVFIDRRKLPVLSLSLLSSLSYYLSAPFAQRSPPHEMPHEFCLADQRRRRVSLRERITGENQRGSFLARFPVPQTVPELLSPRKPPRDVSAHTNAAMAQSTATKVAGLAGANMLPWMELKKTSSLFQVQEFPHIRFQSWPWSGGLRTLLIEGGLTRFWSSHGCVCCLL